MVFTTNLHADAKGRRQRIRDLLKKLPMLGRDLGDLSLDTVRMFHRDAVAARYTL